jgi:RNA polymerase-binding transcription factor DksA
MPSYDADQVESRLAKRMRELEQARTSVDRSADGMMAAEQADVDNHPGDQGTELHALELDVTTGEVFLEEEGRRIAEARRALADGNYGVCKGCGAEIPGDRLGAMPEAVRCLECQRHFEGRHRQQAL